ncbi:MAG: RHS repeat domain-containing protein, partial [Sphingobacteriia bacterium]
MWNPYLDTYIRQRDTLRNVDVRKNHYIYKRGNKHYEMTNHLGNVLSVVTDNHLPVYVGGVLDHYVAQVVQAQDYYAFGAAMEGRSFSISSYRFGFQGMEKEGELYGDGNAYYTQYRMLDVRIGRWFSTDPVVQPWMSPYSAFDNNPIFLVDPLGLKASSGRGGEGGIWPFGGRKHLCKRDKKHKSDRPDKYNPKRHHGHRQKHTPGSGTPTPHPRPTPSPVPQPEGEDKGRKVPEPPIPPHDVPWGTPSGNLSQMRRWAHYVDEVRNGGSGAPDPTGGGTTLAINTNVNMNGEYPAGVGNMFEDYTEPQGRIIPDQPAPIVQEPIPNMPTFLLIASFTEVGPGSNIPGSTDRLNIFTITFHDLPGPSVSPMLGNLRWAPGQGPQQILSVISIGTANGKPILFGSTANASLTA